MVFQGEAWGAGALGAPLGTPLSLPVPTARGPGWAGTITSPGNQHLFWNVQGQLKCVQTLEPQTGQSVTLSVRLVGILSGKRMDFNTLTLFKVTFDFLVHLFLEPSYTLIEINHTLHFLDIPCY